MGFDARPLMKLLREGAQIEYCTYARENTSPSRASWSIVGVCTSTVVELPRLKPLMKSKCEEKA